MRMIPFSEINTVDLHISHIIALHQLWTSHNREFHYRNTPRPNSGLILVLSDQITYTLADHTVLTPSKGDLLYLPQGSYYSVHFSGEENTTLLINFNLFDQSGHPVIFTDQITILLHHCIEQFEESFRIICRKYTETTANKLPLKILLLQLFHELWFRMQTSDTQSRSAAPFPSIAPALLHINSNLTGNYSIRDLARMCAMSESTFRREFHKQLSLSPIQYINSEKFKKARQLLQYSNLSVTEISSMLGFYDNAYFTKTFKKSYGITPAEYRSQITLQ